MSNLLDALKELDDNYPVLIEFHNCIFYINDCEIVWNEDNNLKDLEDLDGNTYDGEFFEGLYKTENYLFANVRNCSGLTITKVFFKSNEVKELSQE